MNEQPLAAANPNKKLNIETVRYESVTACWADMQRRQSAGQKFAAEDYLRPPYSDSDRVVDLVYGEYGLRRAAGEAVDSKEFVRRFPLQALELERQFAMEDILSDNGTARLPLDDRPICDELSTIASPRTPERIGRYLILETLASGGQAVVYRGLHPDLKIEVAVKVSRCESTYARVGTDELVAEGRILASLQHPNIARVIDLDRSEDGPYLVSEYIAGRTLEQYAADQPVSARQAAEIIAKVARGLAVAHRQGVVHLDIKPRNIMIDERGEPRLIDFGLAVRRSIRVDSLAQWSGLRGTVQFMPPEQARADQAPLGPRSDVYALGGVLYFLLTRKFPYGEGLWSEMLEKARLGAWRREDLAQPQIPRALRSVCERALASDPTERFETVDQMAMALERFAQPASVSRRQFLIVGVLVGVGSMLAWRFRSEPETNETPTASMSAETSVVSNLLEIEVWNDGRFLRLADVAPLKSGDRVRISATVPSNHFGSLFVLTSEGRWKLLTHVVPESGVAESGARQFRFPHEKNMAVPLSGAPGTEIIVLCSRPDKPIEVTDLVDKDKLAEPWPHLADMTVLLADSQGVAVLQQGRDFGRPVATPDPESDVRSRLQDLRTRCEQIPGFTAVAFYRE